MKWGGDWLSNADAIQKSRFVSNAFEESVMAETAATLAAPGIAALEDKLASTDLPSQTYQMVYSNFLEILSNRCANFTVCCQKVKKQNKERRDCRQHNNVKIEMNPQGEVTRKTVTSIN